MDYDPDNPFAKILRGEAPAHVVHENDHCMAFMDLMPQTPGHALIIPRAPAAEIFELPPADLRFRISEALKERTVGANEGIIT